MDNSIFLEPIVLPEHLETRKAITRELKKRLKPDRVEFEPIQEEEEDWMRLLNQGMITVDEAMKNINDVFGSPGVKGSFGKVKYGYASGGAGGNGHGSAGGSGGIAVVSNSEYVTTSTFLKK